MDFQIADLTALANGEFHINSRTRPSRHLNDILLLPLKLYRADQARYILRKLRPEAAAITTRERCLACAGWRYCVWQIRLSTGGTRYCVRGRRWRLLRLCSRNARRFGLLLRLGFLRSRGNLD